MNRLNQSELIYIVKNQDVFSYHNGSSSNVYKFPGNAVVEVDQTGKFCFSTFRSSEVSCQSRQNWTQLEW